MMDRLVLGTVQLGMPYGINNRSGKPNFSTACKIIKAAFENGITRFDTAQAYGDSEEVLGKAFKELKLSSTVSVYSKLDPQLDLLDKKAVQISVDESLRKLGVTRLDGLLLHHEEGLQFWHAGLGNTLRDLVTQGKVMSLGASFYTPEKCFSALDIEGINLVQVPANILDRRFETAGVFKKAASLRKEIFIRSVFLQGLLLMEPGAVPGKMAFARKTIAEFAEFASRLNLQPAELALKYALSKWKTASILTGVETSLQIADNARFAAQLLAQEDIRAIEKKFAHVRAKILDPTLWNS